MGNEQIDPGAERLLPGEERAMENDSLGDAKHFVQVYEELYGFKRKLISELDQKMAEAMPASRDELRQDDRIFNREADRLRRRLEYWRGEAASRQ